MSAVAATRLAAESTDGMALYLTDADADQAECAFSSLTTEQRMALTAPRTALNTGFRPGGDDLENMVGGDVYVSPQIARASLGVNQVASHRPQTISEPGTGETNIQNILPSSGIPSRESLSSSMDQLMNDFSSRDKE